MLGELVTECFDLSQRGPSRWGRVEAGVDHPGQFWRQSDPVRGRQLQSPFLLSVVAIAGLTERDLLGDGLIENDADAPDIGGRGELRQWPVRARGRPECPSRVAPARAAGPGSIR